MIQEGRVPQAQRDAYTLQARAAESINIVEVYQLHGAETSITFSQYDHPPVVPRPGHAPLVLDAQIGGYDMDRVFMDGGSSMNIIFASTLQKMLIPRSVWKKSSTMLHGVVPGEAATSLGIVKLEVVFGNRRNFTKQVLEFEVLDWQSQYHAILGGQHSHSSWRCRIMPTSSSRCRDQRESSQSMGASSNLTNVTVTSTKFPTHSGLN